jgi:hypothetical protein
MNDDDPENAASGVIGGDEMFTVRRSERTASTSAPPQESLTYREVLVYRMSAINAELSIAGWPPLLDRIVVGGGDGNSWGLLPVERAVALEAEGHPPEKEVRGRFEFGMNFILRRVKPLTRDYWLVKEADAICRCLDAPDRDAELWAADALGGLVQQAHLHQRHLPAVRRKALHEGRLKTANYRAKSSAERWKTAARAFGKAAWRENPHLPVNVVVRKVRLELARRGIVLPSGKVPQERSVRREIEPIKPGRG